MPKQATVAQPRANEGIAEGLTSFLSDTYILMGKTQGCHWNVTGPNFHGLHLLFEVQYTELFKAVDILAERIRALGSPAPMTIEHMAGLSTLKQPGRVVDAAGMVRMLGDDHAALSVAAAKLADLADEDDDLATHDMLVARIASHDKAAWLLRSHLS